MEGLRAAGRKPWRVDSVVATADHNTPTTDWDQGLAGVREPAHVLAGCRGQYQGWWDPQAWRLGAISIPLVLIGPSLLGQVIPSSLDWVIGAYWPIKGEFDPLPALYRWTEGAGDGTVRQCEDPREAVRDHVELRRHHAGLRRERVAGEGAGEGAG